MSASAKTELLDLLMRKAFDPVLRATPAHRSKADQDKLEYVKTATRAEVDRYRRYGSAEEVVTNFMRDLHSGPAKKVHVELHALHLPTIHDVREAFERKAGDLGLKP